MTFIIEMAFTFIAGFAVGVLVTAIHFSLGNQNSCHENVSNNVDK